MKEKKLECTKIPLVFVGITIVFGTLSLTSFFTQHGLPPLAVSSPLSGIATSHAHDLAHLDP